jgi:hypothetical protein
MMFQLEYVSRWGLLFGWFDDYYIGLDVMLDNLAPFITQRNPRLQCRRNRRRERPTEDHAAHDEV